MTALATPRALHDADARVISRAPLLLCHFAAFHGSSTTQNCRGSKELAGCWNASQPKREERKLHVVRPLHWELKVQKRCLKTLKGFEL